MNVRWLHSHRGLVASMVAAMLVVGVLMVLVIRQRESQASQVYLEAGGNVGSHPFIPLNLPPPVALGNQGGGAGPVQTAAGTDDQVVSDPERLISYLGSHPQAATAWVQALNSDPTLSWSGGNHVDVQHIPAYIHELRPRHLDEDLRVTDYQFINGSAVAIQSLLEKGSLVFVDARGVSRVRCVSGSPLAPMRRLKLSPIYRGTR